MAHLLARSGVTAGARVGIALNRSIDTIVACLAVLKLGAAYLPLDPSYPAAAIAFMIEDAAPEAIIASRNACSPPPLHAGRAILYIEDLAAGLAAEDPAAPAAPLDGETAAYVMYTSGSTGRPKGVVVAHRGVVRLVCGTDFATFGPGDTLLQVGPLAFDYSTLEIFGMLLTGGCIAVLPDPVPSLSAISEGIAREGATCLCLTPALFHLFVDNALEALAPLDRLFVAGDVISVPHLNRYRERYPACRLHNGYGPTENTTFTTCYTMPVLTPSDTEPCSSKWGGGPVPIGPEIAGTTVYLLDEAMQPVAPGVTGTLWTGGLGVALGYLNRPDLTQERFKPDPFCGVDGAMMYNTGDLAFQRPDGCYAFAGRLDRQVKAGGKRIELDAIEAALRADARVLDAAAVARTDDSGNKEIIAFCKVVGPGAHVGAAILTDLAGREPAFMIPARIVTLASFPVTPSGKINRTQLACDFESVLAAEAAKAAGLPAGDDTGSRLTRIWSRALQRSPIDPETNFFDLGGSSLRMIAVHAMIQKEIRTGITIADLFAHPTLASLTAFLSEGSGTPEAVAAARRRGKAASSGRGAFDGIAIVGVAGRFPGAAGVSQFWDNLLAGTDSIRHFSDAELEDSFDAETRSAGNFVKARAIIDGADQFDADFFRMQPREAALTDPQQRMFLELCWHVLEDAGYDPARHRGPIGVFAGSSLNTYFLRQVMSNRDKVDDFTSNLQVGNYGELLGTLHDFLTTRVAYKLDLRGPAIGMQTACSTSLTAICEACKSLTLHECDMALAGGVSLTFPQKRGYQYTEGGMVSADGICRPFDAAANGTVFGDGAAVVALKRLSDAVAGGDQIYAVIKGWGLNNDGHAKMGFTAPSSEGQAQVIAAAHAMAGIEPATIGYVECHGTATPLGDPIEFAGLSAAFSGASANACYLGSAKGNVGHLDAAAGVTGLIKAALTLKHGTIPPLAHFKSPNPNMPLAGSPFAFNADAVAWPPGSAPRRCGVSAFGVGGTNAHVVLEEAPSLPTIARPEPSPASPVLLTVSARTPAALKVSAEALACHIEATPNISLADMAATLLHGRRTFAYRMAVAAHSPSDAVQKLRNCHPGQAVSGERAPVVFLFPGQGAQRPGMARGLYDTVAVAREWIDRGLAHLKPALRAEVSDYLLAVPDTDDAASAASDTRFVQPALFLTEHAIARAFESIGVSPDVMIGHSLGEFVAAVIAGVTTFEAALDLIATRAALMQDIAPGAMSAVRLSEADLRARLPAGIDVAAINGPNLCTVAGPFLDIEAFEASLARDEIPVQRLRTSHAFHSAMMDPVVAPLQKLAAAAQLSAPRKTVLSTVTGQLLTAHEATDPGYWARHSRLPVRFGDAARAARMQYPNAIFIEAGPGEALCALTAQVRDAEPARAAVRSLSPAASGHAPHDPLAEAVARLWAEGVPADLRWYLPTAWRRISLPLYPFERSRHWIDRPAAVSHEAPRALPAPPSIPQAPTLNGHDVSTPSTTAGVTMTIARTETESKIIAMLEELSGASLGDAPADKSFFDLGYDSLFMAQIATKLQKTFKIKVTFRQLMRDYPTIRAVAGLIPEQPKAAAPVAVRAASANAPGIAAAVAPAASASSVGGTSGSAIEQIVREQLAAMQQIMSQQLALVAGTNAGAGTTSQPATVAIPASAAPAATAAPDPAAAKATADLIALSETQSAARFKVYGNKPAQQAEVTPRQQAFIADLITRTSSKSPKTKAYVQAHRRHLADPRSAAGFRAEWKEMVFPVVAQRARGSKLWDLDGNEYVDLVNGYGQTMFGHSPPFVTAAIEAQMRDGFPIGPQTPLAGEVAERFARMTGTERVTFCNTGSEAVMAAMRIARTVTGRDKIVSFAGDYHGQFDEVLVKAGMIAGEPGGAPICPGIPSQSVSNMIVLPYGHDASLAYIEANADDIAAVLVESVQSRHPGLRPQDFLKRLREITEASGTAMVMDEIVTGFRVGPAGAQGYYKIQGDMATYGKVVGGGMPIGVLAGKAAFMDALDSGYWSFGDDSVPEAAPTFFAGTFVRHPLVLAAARAVLMHLEAEGPALYARMETTTAAMAARLNGELTRRGIAAKVEHFASFFYFDLSHDDRLGALFYYHMRLLGVHIQDGFPCFLTTAHTAADIAFIEDAFCQSLDALQSAGILAPADGVATPLQVAPAACALTEPQQEIYLIAQLGDKPSCVYNESITLSFSGPFDAAAMRGALADLVARHDALRATFDAAGETMRIAPTLDLDIALIDLSGEADSADAFSKLLSRDANLAFDLQGGPLVRGMLVRHSATSHALVVTAHHLICDGWSMGIIIQDLGALYSARRDGRDAGLPPAASFLDYARGKAVDTSVNAAADAYWLSQYRELPVPLELPTDHPRPMMASFDGASATGWISAELQKRLKQAGARSNATMFAVLFASVQALLGRLAGTSDVVLAVPAGGQSLLDEPSVVGHLVNFLPVRAAFDFDEPFATHLERATGLIYAALDHQDYTLGTLMRRLDTAGDLKGQPLTRVQFNLERIGENLDFAGLTATMAPNPKAAVYSDVFFNFIEGTDGIRIDVDYSTELFDAATITRWIDHLAVMLDGIASNPGCAIGDLPLLTPQMRNWLLTGANQPVADIPPGPATYDLIAAQTERTPDAVAVVSGKGTLTYRQLDDAANRLAARIAALVPKTGERVALLVERSLELPVAMLAVWKAGHAYLPLDPGQPAARLAQIIETGRPAAVVSTGPLPSDIVPAGVPVVRLHDAAAEGLAVAPVPAHRLLEQPVAYVIFTSGTTGQPKGVEVTHAGLSNVLQSVRAVPGFTASDRMLAVSTIAFDVAHGEILLPLISGGVVEIAAAEDVRDGFALAKRLACPEITFAHATPSLWQLVSEAGFTPRPGLLMTYSGEPMSKMLALTLMAGQYPLWNLYGPTEASIWASIDRVPEDGGAIIQRPAANSGLYLLDSRRRLAAPGATGDLWIGGRALAKGYFDRADLTDAAFQTVTLDDGIARRLYRTGDIGRRRNDGAIVLLGRSDHQVKLSGYRIELPEIEHVLRQHPAIADCAVTVAAFADGDRRLAAYYVPKPGIALVALDLSAHVGTRLPSYMVPGLWKRLDALPLSPNGKLDRKALPPVERSETAIPVLQQVQQISTQAPIVIPDAVTTRAAAASEAGPSKAVELIRDVWSDVLGIEMVPVDQPLLSLGARSLHLFRIAGRLQKSGLAVTARQLMTNPTIAELALDLDQAAGSPAAAALTAPSLKSFRRTQKPGVV